MLAHGFDPTAFSSRINQYLNDAQFLVARRVDYYVDEAVDQFTTTSGTATYPWPTNLARMRSLFDTGRNVELEFVSIRDIDRSGPVQGAPSFYALTGSNVQLYPTPDNAYALEMRYWQLPSTLVVDTDTPSIPADWHHLLWVYATAICYEAEDDPQMGQYWMGRFNNELAMFAADQKFPDSDGPVQARGMWEGERVLGNNNSWTLYGQGW